LKGSHNPDTSPLNAFARKDFLPMSKDVTQDTVVRAEDFENLIECGQFRQDREWL
jgi:hypothetical protein